MDRFFFLKLHFLFLGDLLVICANEGSWWPRRVTVRGGQLHVSSAPGEGSPASFRIPLRQLSLRAGRLPNSLALCKGQNVILTLQVIFHLNFLLLQYIYRHFRIKILLKYDSFVLHFQGVGHYSFKTNEEVTNFKFKKCW